jgi:hypothetical protein
MTHDEARGPGTNAYDEEAKRRAGMSQADKDLEDKKADSTWRLQHPTQGGKDMKMEKAEKEYNADGRKKVEEHAKQIHNQIQHLLEDHGKVISQYGDEFHTPGHLANFHTVMGGFKIPYTEKHARFEGGKITTTDVPKTYLHNEDIPERLLALKAEQTELVKEIVEKR